MVKLTKEKQLEKDIEEEEADEELREKEFEWDYPEYEQVEEGDTKFMELLSDKLNFPFEQRCNIAVSYILRTLGKELKDPKIRMGNVEFLSEPAFGSDEYKSIRDYWDNGFDGHFWVEDGDHIYDILQSSTSENNEDDYDDEENEQNRIAKIHKGHTNNNGYNYAPAHPEVEKYLINHYVGKDKAEREERMKFWGV
jgi:hypothetical protein